MALHWSQPFRGHSYRLTSVVVDLLRGSMVTVTFYVLNSRAGPQF